MILSSSLSRLHAASGFSMRTFVGPTRENFIPNPLAAWSYYISNRLFKITQVEIFCFLKTLWGSWKKVSLNYAFLQWWWPTCGPLFSTYTRRWKAAKMTTSFSSKNLTMTKAPNLQLNKNQVTLLVSNSKDQIVNLAFIARSKFLMTQSCCKIILN